MCIRDSTRIAEQPPSQKNTQLLSALLPYYRMIAIGKNLPESKVCEANAVIGECALRTGSYALAEEAVSYTHLDVYKRQPLRRP